MSKLIDQQNTFDAPDITEQDRAILDSFIKDQLKEPYNPAAKDNTKVIKFGKVLAVIMRFVDQSESDNKGKEMVSIYIAPGGYSIDVYDVSPPTEARIIQLKPNH